MLFRSLGDAYQKRFVETVTVLRSFKDSLDEENGLYDNELSLAGEGGCTGCEILHESLNYGMVAFRVKNYMGMCSTSLI